MSLTFTLALTVLDAETPEDVLIRGNAEQTVGELARRVAVYLGRGGSDAAGAGIAYGLRVERTGEQLRPDAPLSSVDLLEGDTVSLLIPKTAERRRPRWADDDSEAADRIIALRPRRKSEP